MECYNCGATLASGKRCPKCGADVRIYKRIIYTSNFYYNDGLHKAQVRDLSGAADALNKSLSLNKNNIDARNLLGLVYFEMGETVSALSEWVISKNIIKKGNVADRYLKEIQNNPNRLDTINQTIKKYNQALAYCRQDSRDLAVIQLKKVLALNPKFVKAHQLMALLYIEEGQYERAKKALRQAASIDENNTITLRYTKEVNKALKDKTNKPKKKDNIITYQSGTETIIMPATFTDSSPLHTLINMVIGIVLGICVCIFLIVPNMRANETSTVSETLKEVNDNLATKENEVSELEAQIEEMQSSLDDANQSIEDSDTRLNSYKQLINAFAYAQASDWENAGNALSEVVTADLNDEAKSQYSELEATVSENYMALMYTEGTSAYNKGDYETAINDLLKVVQTDETYEDGNAVYYLGQSYRRNGDMANAAVYYQKIIESHPGTQRAKTAQSYLDQYQSSEDGQMTNGNDTAAEAEAAQTTAENQTTDNQAATDAQSAADQATQDAVTQ